MSKALEITGVYLFVLMVICLAPFIAMEEVWREGQAMKRRAKTKGDACPAIT